MSFSSEERLTLLLSFAWHEPDEAAEVKRLARQSHLDWAKVDQLASHNAIRPLAHKHLVEYGEWHRVPEAIAAPWAAFSATIAEHNRRRLELATPLFTQAAAEGIQIAILKGIYFAPTYYGDVGYKKMNDIDLLMHTKDLDRLYALYAEHGFFSLGKLLDDDKQLTFSHHAPPFFHQSLGCMLGTHWGLISPLTMYEPDYAAMWTRAVPFEFLGARHYALHPVDNLHHLCIHLPYYKLGLRELADLYNLLRAETGFDWTLFLAEVEKAGTQELVYHALSVSHALVPMSTVATALARLAPQVSGFYAKDAVHRSREPRRILYGRSTLMSEIDKAFGEFTMTDHLPTKLKAYWGMWGNCFFAPPREVARFHYVEPTSPTLMLLYPSMVARVFRYVAKDLGWKILLLVIVSHQLDLWKCAFRTIMGRNKPDKLATAAASHGLTGDQIATLRSLLE